MQTVTPFLWFNDNAEEAVNFYHSVFSNSIIHKVVRCGDSGPESNGAVVTVEFEINGQEFVALNGGPVYTLSPAISFQIGCETQEEINELWNKLSEGGEMLRCGWLTDKFGITWQVIPSALGELLAGPDPEGAGRVMKAMMKMVKIDLPTLRLVYDREIECGVMVL